MRVGGKIGLLYEKDQRWFFWENNIQYKPIDTFWVFRKVEFSLFHTNIYGAKEPGNETRLTCTPPQKKTILNFFPKAKIQNIFS